MKPVTDTSTTKTQDRTSAGQNTTAVESNNNGKGEVAKIAKVGKVIPTPGKYQSHPNSLANLRSPWTKENHPNPLVRGRRKAGATIREWFNVLVAMELSKQDVIGIVEDDRQPVAKVAAARQLIRMAEDDDRTTESLLIVTEQTDGKPVQPTEISTLSPADVAQRLSEFFGLGMDQEIDTSSAKITAHDNATPKLLLEPADAPTPTPTAGELEAQSGT